LKKGDVIFEKAPPDAGWASNAGWKRKKKLKASRIILAGGAWKGSNMKHAK